MRVRSAVVVVVLVGVVAVAGCSGGGDGDQVRGPGTTAGSTTTTTVTAAGAEAALQSALFRADDLAIRADPEYSDGTGLGVPTFDYCDLPHHGDDLRIARVQQWWKSDQVLGHAGEPGVADGKLTLGSEIVLYSPDGVETVLAAMANLPETCPQQEYHDEYESFIAFGPAPTPAGLPDGTVAVTADVTYRSNGFLFRGRIVAIPAGDVVAVLYVWADTSLDIDDITARYATLLADRVASTDLGEL